MLRTRAVPLALTGLLAACTLPPVAPAHDTDAGGIPCPGPQCPCPCAAPLTCGPHGACTRPCSAPEDCGAVAGETCLAGLCGVVCDPGGPDDCGAVGMAGGSCLQIQGTAVCGYRPETAAADETGPTK